MRFLERIPGRASRITLAALIGLALPLLGRPGAASGQEMASTREYQIKASLIVNFLEFVEWPPAELAARDLKICLLNADRYLSAIRYLERQLVRGKQLVSVPVTLRSPDLSSCQVLVIGDAPEQADAIKQVASHSVLTVGESTGFLDLGGIINFQIEDKKVVFDVNRQAALGARLNLSSKLLRYARRVIEEPRES